MDGIELPVTRYALSGDVSIAHQVMGVGPVDIIMIPGFMSHIEFQHELAGWTAFCVASPSSLESLLSINEDRGYPTEYPTRLRSNSGWMTFAQLWMQSDPNERRSLGIPKVVR
jgi:hypothetical protein